MDRTSVWNRTAAAGNATTDDPVEFGLAFTCLDVTVISVMSLLSVFGNAVVIVSVTTVSRYRTSINIYIANLALADGLFGLIFPIIIPNLMLHRNTLDHRLCRSWGLATGICVLTTTFTMTLIAVSRYVFVAHPRRCTDFFTVRVNLSLCGVAWALATTVLLLSQTGWSDAVFNPKTHACSFARDDGSYQHFLLSTGIVAPLLFICLFYLLLFSAVQRSKNKVKNGPRTMMTSSFVRTTAVPAGECSGPVVKTSSSVAMTTNSDPLSPANGHVVASRSLTVLRPDEMELFQTEANLDSFRTRSSTTGLTRQDMTRTDGGMTKVDIALTKTMVIIFVGFVLCFVVYYVVNVVDKRACCLPIWVHKLAGWCLDFHSCLNPIIYRMRNRQFKEDCGASRWYFCVGRRQQLGQKKKKNKKKKDAAKEEKKEEEGE